jgi:predicted acetyltransferase
MIMAYITHIQHENFVRAISVQTQPHLPFLSACGNKRFVYKEMKDYSSRRQMNIRKLVENKLTGDSIMGTEQAVTYSILVEDSDGGDYDNSSGDGCANNDYEHTGALMKINRYKVATASHYVIVGLCHLASLSVRRLQTDINNFCSLIITSYFPTVSP